MPRQEPAFNLEDELLRDIRAYSTLRVRSPASIVRPSLPPRNMTIPQPRPSSSRSLSIRRVPTSPAGEEAEVLSAADWVAPQASEPVFGGARDLIEELELSIGGRTVQIPQASAPAKAPQWSAASIKLPLANFHAARRDEAG